MASSLVSQKVLVLGGGGYIGSHFRRAYSGDNFIFLKHSDVDLLQQEFYNQIKIILNLSASRLNASKEDSRSANFNFPKAILKRISDKPIKWVQAASYYELQVPKGRSDFYSLDKVAFRDFLFDSTAEKKHLAVTSLVLPHIFGGNENNSRIIPTLKKMNNGEVVELGSGNQLLPILHVMDAVRALYQALLSEQLICTPRPMWHGRLHDLVSSLANSSAAFERCMFNDVLDKHQESPLEYPALLENFSPMLSYERFVESFKNGDLK
jgi:nucleoside-diphosphate-sugar epimerase